MKVPALCRKGNASLQHSTKVALQLCAEHRCLTRPRPLFTAASKLPAPLMERVQLRPCAVDGEDGRRGQPLPYNRKVPAPAVPSAAVASRQAVVSRLPWDRQPRRIRPPGRPQVAVLRLCQLGKCTADPASWRTGGDAPPARLPHGTLGHEAGQLTLRNNAMPMAQTAAQGRQPLWDRCTAAPHSGAGAGEGGNNRAMSDKEEPFQRPTKAARTSGDLSSMRWPHAFFHNTAAEQVLIQQPPQQSSTLSNQVALPRKCSWRSTSKDNGRAISFTI